MAEVFIDIRSENLPQSAIQTISASALREMNKIPNVDARPKGAPHHTDDKGIISKAGEIIAKISDSKAVDRVLSLIEVFLGRNKSVIIAIKLPDGTSIDLNASNFDIENSEQTRLFVRSLINKV